MTRKTVVVTGASAGVGRATARAFGARGDRVALLARGRDGVDRAAEEVTAAGGTALPITVDVSGYEDVTYAADRVENELGPIDIWVNNAVATVFAPFTEIEPQEFRRVTDVTYHGCVYGTRAALDRMLPRDRGVIVQVGSALAYRGIPLQSAYCAAKHAIQGFTESVRCELLHDGSRVRITMVQLPGLNTPQFEWSLARLHDEPQPIPPIYEPEVAARAVLHAARHPRRREYEAGYSSVATITANKLAPGLLDRYLARTGYRSQHSGVPARPDDPANLWRPVDDEAGTDRGARGPFSAKARSFSPQLWLSRHRLKVAITAGALATAGGRALARRR